MQGYNCSRQGKHPQFTFDYSGCPVLPTGFFAKNPGTWHGVRPIRPLFTSVWMWLIRGSQVSCRLRILISWVQGLEFNWFLFLVGGFGGFPSSPNRSLPQPERSMGTGSPPGHARPAFASLAPWPDSRCPSGGSADPDPQRRDFLRRCRPLPFPVAGKVLPRPDYPTRNHRDWENGHDRLAGSRTTPQILLGSRQGDLPRNNISGKDPTGHISHTGHSPFRP